jgi:hypothetical protein
MPARIFHDHIVIFDVSFQERREVRGACLEMVEIMNKTVEG